MADNGIKIIIDQKCYEEAKEVLDFFSTISDKEKELLLVFILGARFGKCLSDHINFS